MMGGLIVGFISQIEKVFIKHLKIFLLVLGLFLVITFLVRGIFFLDPDFGWRLRTGEIILNQGIPHTDPFSYTMPSFPFVDHAWSFSSAIALLYPSTGLSVLAGILLVVTILTLWFRTLALRSKDYEKYSLVTGKLWFLTSPVFILAISIFIPYFSVRAQVLTWFMLALVLNIILNQKIYEKFKFYLPLIFLVWANLHGGFFSGLTSLLIVFVVRMVKTKRVNLTDISILLLSLAVTFINPYGIGDWREVLSSTFDSKLRWTIQEWMPTITSFDLSVAAYIPLSFLFILRYRKKFSLEEIIIYLFFFLQGISSRRHFPLWVIVSLPMTIDSLSYFFRDILGKSQSVLRFNILYKILWYISLFLVLLQSYLGVWSALVIKTDTGVPFYPNKAIAYLKSNLPDGNIFADYGWGGYLIWQMPEKKVFIDGRMPSWKFNPPDQNESSYAFEEYLKITNGEMAFQDISKKYSIDTVLTNVTKENFESLLMEKILNFESKFRKVEPKYNFVEDLKKNGWAEIYRDETAVILKKR